MRPANYRHFFFQVRQGVIENGRRASPTKPIVSPQPLEQIHLEFKPLVQVDPSVLSTNRVPVKNPRPGDYMLSKTASTEGIASKKSLELKKRYLLGEATIPGGLMKSDSTSVLDSKFRNFHSNISECQKLLNAAAPTKIPVLQQSPLATTKPEITTVPLIPSINVKNIDPKDSEEKENLYGEVVEAKNKLNQSADQPPSPDISPKSLNILNANETKNEIVSSPTTPKNVEIIDLCTPEKQQSPVNLDEIRSENEISKKAIQKNRDLISKMDKRSDSGCEIIDLTNDTPEKDRPADDDVRRKSAENDEIEIISIAERSKNAIDSMLKRGDYKKSKSVDDESTQPPRSPVHETSIEVPHIPWNSKVKSNELESDSLSSSTTSSVDDIPHYILDSTTSPDTLPGDRFVPRLEVRDTSGELMQIDSLMIIDGKYVGDPDDLKHMQMPDGTSAIAECTPPKESKVTFDESCNLPEKPKPYKYESIASKKPELKFDTKNENKIDTLKNIPLVLSPPNREEKPQKPNVLLLNETNKPQSDPGSDVDKTPVAGPPSELTMSDSETEVTGPVLTETELSDWNADDAVSENFVDIEFVLNSNKGTIKRNKKKKKNGGLMSQAVRKAAETEQHKCPLAKDLDFDGIEFMDTGSEDSCLETYSATNKALLKNRGYVKFVDSNYANNGAVLSYKSDAGYGSSPKEYSERSPKAEAVNTEISGVDYIEQGACILGNDIDLKTPMNEPPSIFTVKQPSTHSSEQPDSLNEMEEDSLLMIASQGTTTATTTTTEESDALTIVTSPVDSTPKNAETPSSEKNTSSSPPRDASATNSSLPSDEVHRTYDTVTQITDSSKYTQLSDDDEDDDDVVDEEGLMNNNRHKEMDECSYGDYVRKLQMKITKISNARDSIDVRKTKRKHSKGDISSGEQLNSVIDSNKSLSIYKCVEEPSTVMERIEKISKERTKQKDLIHDLVMDKLQSKKQLNAEKRLNRSRNRNMMFSPLANNNNSNLSTPPSLSLAGGESFAIPHCHPTTVERRMSGKSTDQHSVPQTPTGKPIFFAPTSKNISTIKTKERPLSDNLERPIMSEPPKIMKTQSFCVYSARNMPAKTDLLTRFDSVNGFNTPTAPPRRKADDPAITETERMRQDARARARLKSNQDLGLSPDEKIQLLRKRFQLDGVDTPGQNKSDDMKVRERKMMSSKSVNDIHASQDGILSAGPHGGGTSSKKQYKLNDFISDPNLLEPEQRNQKRTTRQQKDPDRRKSIIKAVSDFFYKKKDKDVSPGGKEKSSDSVFGRFRISPKSKAKVRFIEFSVFSFTKKKYYLKVDTIYFLLLKNDFSIFFGYFLSVFFYLFFQSCFDLRNFGFDVR